MAHQGDDVSASPNAFSRPASQAIAATTNEVVRQAGGQHDGVLVNGTAVAAVP